MNRALVAGSRTRIAVMIATVGLAPVPPAALGQQPAAVPGPAPGQQPAPVQRPSLAAMSATATAVAAAETRPIDLPTVLRLAGLNDLDVALVREAEQQARAANQAATLQFFPWLGLGAGYDKHSGAATELGLLERQSSQLYTRAGALNEQVELGNAIFEKLAAVQAQRAAGYDVEASQNDAALAAADAYFDLVNAGADADIAREAVRISQDYEGQLSRAYQAGLTNRSEVLRVGVQTQNDRVALRQAEAAVPSLSAVLATLLRLDPAAPLTPTERLVRPPLLVEVDTPVGALIKDALSLRPEVRASAARISAASEQRRAARYGPLIPQITGQAALSQLRGGQDDVLQGFYTSHDYVLALNWRIGPGGLFDPSRTAAANAALRTQQLNADKVHDNIAQQVVQAHEAARAGADGMGLALRAVELAEESLKLSEQRKEFGVYAVLEVIQAQQDLTQARVSYSTALTQYAKAQYALAYATARIGSR